MGSTVKECKQQPPNSIKHIKQERRIVQLHDLGIFTVGGGWFGFPSQLLVFWSRLTVTALPLSLPGLSVHGKVQESFLCRQLLCDDHVFL